MFTLDMYSLALLLDKSVSTLKTNKSHKNNICGRGYLVLTSQNFPLSIGLSVHERSPAMRKWHINTSMQQCNGDAVVFLFKALVFTKSLADGLRHGQES